MSDKNSMDRIGSSNILSISAKRAETKQRCDKCNLMSKSSKFTNILSKTEREREEAIVAKCLQRLYLYGTALVLCNCCLSYFKRKSFFKCKKIKIKSKF